MVYRWQCRSCDWTTWSTSREQTEQEAKSHLVGHYRDKLSKSSLGIQWTCPYCEQVGQSGDRSEGIERYADHLFSHAESLIEPDVHVAEEFHGTGSVLVLSALETAGADNARKHFLSPGDILMFVTTRPQRRIRLVRDELGEWPSLVVVVTSQEKPLDGLSGVDPSSLPLEVVQIDGTASLSTLGQTLSRVLQEHEQSEGKISFEFDILSELLTTFDLQQVFRFLHVLTARLEKANALSHFFANPGVQSESSINVLDPVFDIKLTAEDRVFTSEPTVRSPE
jgi:hypothetical protein